MGNQCCGNDTIDNKNTINTKNSDLQQLMSKMTAKQLSLLIKCQARIRGLLTRNQIRKGRDYGNLIGLNGFRQLDSGSLRTDYENQKVLVSYFF